MQKSFSEIERELKNKIYHPLYILEGEEPYYNEVLTDYFENHILSDAEKGFNLTIVYGKDVNDSKIAALANSYPMFGNYNIVIVKEAQFIKDWSALSQVAASLPKTTILALFISGATLDKRKTEIKQLISHAVHHSTKKLKESEIQDFIAAYIKKHKHKISPDTVQLLTDHVNQDLSFIVNEMNKLILNVPAEKEITAAHVQEFIGIHKEYNVFALTKALGTRQIKEALLIADYFSRNSKENPLVVILSQLYSYFNKVLLYRTMRASTPNEIASALGVNPYFIKEYESAARVYTNARLFNIFELLKEYDLRSKKIIENESDDGVLIRELVMRIVA
jgi:DNA polymerase-3 subunit delta